MNEFQFWQIIEDAWAASPALLEKRNEVLRTNDAAIIEDLTGEVYGTITNNIHDILLKLNREELIQFNLVMEQKLFQIDRKEIQEYTDGSNDGFLYCRCFIVGMGKDYYEMIDQNPSAATYDAEAEIVGFIGYMVYQELFNEEFERYTIHSIESCSNPEGWAGV
ncbi:DUF4240 domain-containing protein [Chitinophaga silvatica]|uniref:DUF4240 domain-containing protein n=1 Tax=Chitinophaga silvatica TaxID=2282649 RepID=A0A3E1YEJ5_9BACT|nr:DUF4240 domain-containing protein [Chitinophaga silvatica]RFS24980.1 DUF4240 domain-containing protein [Chitinophaga silvatica]